MGLNLHWQGTWTNEMFTGEESPVCECTVECTLWLQLCPVHPDGGLE